MSQNVFSNPYVSSLPTLTGVGNGTLTVDKLTHFTITQTYTVICTAVAPFTVFNVVGSLDGPVGVAVVATQFNDEDLKVFFTIQQGPTAFDVGDTFEFTVTQGTDLNQQNIDTYDELPQKNFGVGIEGQLAGDHNLRFNPSAALASLKLQDILYTSNLLEEQGNRLLIEYYNTSVATEASLVLQDLTYTAQSTGVLGNNISIEYEEHTPGVNANITIQDIVWFARTAGAAGNSIQIEYIDDVAYGAEYSDLVGLIVQIHIASGASEAQRVRVAASSNPAVNALVGSFNTGTGLDPQTGPVAPTNLTGGADAIGDAGNEVVAVIGDAIKVTLESGVSTAQQVKDAIDADLSASALVSVSITGTASNPQSAPVAVTNLAGGLDSQGAPGFEVIDVVNTHHIRIGFQSGINTADDIINAVNAHPQASSLVVASLNGTALDPQIAPAVRYLTGGFSDYTYAFNKQELTSSFGLFYEGNGNLLVNEFYVQGKSRFQQESDFYSTVDLDDLKSEENNSGPSVVNLQKVINSLIQNQKAFLQTENNSRLQWTAPNLTFSSPLVVRFEDTGRYNRILSSVYSPIVLNDGESAYAVLNRQENVNIDLVVASEIPTGQDVIRIATRSGSFVILHDNTILSDGQIARIGAAIDLSSQIFTLIESSGQIAHSETTVGEMSWNAPIYLRRLGSAEEITLPADTITLLDDQVAYVQLDDPFISDTKSVLVADRSQVFLDDPEVFWLFHRYGNKVNVRFVGEVEQGEERNLGDTISDDIFGYIGSAGETDNDPDYLGSTSLGVGPAYVSQGDSLTKAIKILDEIAIDNVNVRLVEGGEWAWDLSTQQLSWESNAFLSINGLPNARNTIPVSASPIQLLAGECAYVIPNRTTGVASDLTIFIDTIDNIPRDEDVLIIARRQTDDVMVGQDTLLEDGDSVKLGKGGGGGVGFQETLGGVSNGVNTVFGPLTYVPSSEDSIIVFVDYVAVDKSLWQLNGSSIEFTGSLIPDFAQSVYVFYLTEGAAFAPPTAASGTPIVEYRTITAGEELAEELTLANLPGDPTKVMVDIIGGTAQRYNTDYTVVADTLRWQGFNLETLLNEGDELRIFYFI